MKDKCFYNPMVAFVPPLKEKEMILHPKYLKSWKAQKPKALLGRRTSKGKTK
ncbi:hypothetical protein FHS90_003898 [Rufibacter quisquiliarum]|uniref:Uncharacterized protein n=1 Tax=Rufibacter quisquiliarum TaxID=1549639 RepID=A0A839GMP4_9BACT|nr:hypothetical protein [Rufibacter quisquiliarum]